MGTARDFLRLYRVRDWLHFLPLPLAGWFTAGTHSIRAVVGGVLGWGLALAYTSAMNQAFDDRLDQRQAEKNPVGGRFNRRQAVLFSLPPAVASVAVVGALSPSGLVPLLVLLIAATVYSAPPRLKRVPVLGTLCNLVVGIPGLFFAGRPEVTRQPLQLFAGLFALLLLISQLIHEAEDHDDDRAGGIDTVATVTGIKGALMAAVGFLLLMPGAVWWLANGLRSRQTIALATLAFAAVWAGALVNRIVRGDGSAIRRLRLRYRYWAFALGALVYGVATGMFT